MNLLLAAALLLQDTTAEETFKKIEETFGKAKTARLDYTSVFTANRGGTEFVYELSGSLLLKEGNKAFFTSQAKAMGQVEEYSTVCDGTKLLARQPRRAGSPKDAPKEFVSDLTAVFLRGGIYLVFAANRSSKSKDDMKSLYELFELKHGEDDKDAKTLIYKVRFPEGGLDCTVRYNPKSWLVTERTMKFHQNGADLGTVRETYKDVTLNADLPDEKFKLPEEGKKDPAREALARTNLASLHTALSQYQIDSGKYPTTEQGLAALVSKPDGAKNWNGPYLDGKQAPLDPWGNAYGYRSPGDKNRSGYDLFSSGPDGKPGTADDIEK